jgi:hypothetical protein
MNSVYYTYSIYQEGSSVIYTINDGTRKIIKKAIRMHQAGFIVCVFFPDIYTTKKLFSMAVKECKTNIELLQKFEHNPPTTVAEK